MRLQAANSCHCGYRRNVGERARAGALIGALTAAVLAAVGYLGCTLAGFPFAPFDLFDWIARGELEVNVGATYPLAEAGQAHDDLVGRRTTGKLLLLPG